jgi:hypothetical protein
MRRRLFVLMAILPLHTSLPLWAQQADGVDDGALPISVTHDNGAWRIKGAKQTVVLDEKTFALRVEAGDAVWSMVPSEVGDLHVKRANNISESSLRLADAGTVKIEPYDAGFKKGVKFTLSDWGNKPERNGSAPAETPPIPGSAEAASSTETDLTLYLTVALDGRDEDLVFDIAAREGATVVRQLDWPSALDSRDIDLTALSNIRGVLLPRNWPKAYHPIRPDNQDGSKPEVDSTEVQSNIIECWSMSWWGFQRGKNSMMVIVETPDDAAYQFSHPAGGPTVIGPRWRTSLGKLDDVRTARMCFLPDGNYVDMAKRYRRYAQETGLFVSLEEKIARAPTVAKLIGAPLMRAGILTNIKEDSARFKKARKPEDNYRLTTFDERGEAFRKLKAGGLDRLTVVLTGWPKLGYDRQHPDVLPPAPVAGGWEGMQRLAATCNELGYLFSLHDQYRDYYLDAPSYDEQFAIHEEAPGDKSLAFPGSRFGNWKEGVIPYMDNWDGGKMTYLNGRFMLGHLAHNYEEMFAHGIHPQGNYLDVFGYVPPDEDFNPEHPTTRADCLRERARCYNWSRMHLGFVGTEAACDWTVPFADISSPLTTGGGVPAPLFNLVYHDAIITTYAPDDLHGLLNAGAPQIGGRQPVDAKSLARVRRMGALHERLAKVEMTGHEFLDATYRKERTTFADGTTVTVDWDAKTAEINPPVDGP